MTHQEILNHLRNLKATLSKAAAVQRKTRSALSIAKVIQSSLEDLDQALRRLEKAAKALELGIKAIPPVPAPIAGQVVKVVKLMMRSSLNALEALIASLDKPLRRIRKKADELAETTAALDKVLEELDQAIGQGQAQVQRLQGFIEQWGHRLIPEYRERLEKAIEGLTREGDAIDGWVRDLERLFVPVLPLLRSVRARFLTIQTYFSQVTAVEAYVRDLVASTQGIRQKIEAAMAYIPDWVRSTFVWVNDQVDWLLEQLGIQRLFAGFLSLIDGLRSLVGFLENLAPLLEKGVPDLKKALTSTVDLKRYSALLATNLHAAYKTANESVHKGEACYTEAEARAIVQNLRSKGVEVDVVSAVRGKFSGNVRKDGSLQLEMTLPNPYLKRIWAEEIQHYEDWMGMYRHQVKLNLPTVGLGSATDTENRYYAEVSAKLFVLSNRKALGLGREDVIWILKTLANYSRGYKPEVWHQNLDGQGKKGKK